MSRFHARRRTLASIVTAVIALPLGLLLAPTSASGAVSFQNIGLHDRGTRVVFVQRTLDVPRTGSYNVRTRKAVKSFQRPRDIAATGVVNQRTWTALQRRWDRIQSVRVQQRREINAKYDRIVKVARNQFGAPYQFGAAGPSAFDCSGYTMFVYAKATGKSLPHLAGSQARRGDRISRKQARPGDLVFFQSGGSVYHAAIYAGHGDIYHSARPGTVVQRDPIWSSNVFFVTLLR